MENHETNEDCLEVKREKEVGGNMPLFGEKDNWALERILGKRGEIHADRVSPPQSYSRHRRVHD